MECGPLDLKKEDCLLFSRLCKEVNVGILIVDTSCIETIRLLFINNACKALFDDCNHKRYQSSQLEDCFQHTILPLIFSSLNRSMIYKTKILQALALGPEVSTPTHLCHMLPLEEAGYFQNWYCILFEPLSIDDAPGPSATLNRYIGGLAHDFNNLLMIIHSYAELLKLKLSAHSEVYGYLAPVQQASSRAGVLVEQMLQVCQDSFHTKKIFNLKDTILEIKNILEYTLSENDQIQIKTELKDAFIEANPCDIEQILTNLCLNAKQAMPRGGHITIRLEPEPGEEYVCLSVEDQGQGIEPSIQEYLFEPNVTTKAHKLGHGFGLFNIASIVKKLEGFIEVRSVPGQGSIFSLFFKQASLQKQHEIKALKTAEEQLPSKKIIIILEPDAEETEKLLLLFNTQDHQALDYSTHVDILEQDQPVVAVCLGPHVKGSRDLSVVEGLLEKVLKRHPHLKIISLSNDPELEKHLKDSHYSRLFCFPNLSHSVHILKVLPSILNINTGRMV